MKKLACFLSLVVVASAAFAQKEESSTRRELTEYFRTLGAAIEKEDMKKVLTLMDPSYVSVNVNGDRMNLEQCKAMWTQGLAMMRDIKVVITVKNVQLQKMEANVWYEMKMSGTMGTGKDAQKTSFTTRYCDTLVNRGGWKAVYSMELPTNEPWSFKTEGGGR